VLHKVSSTLTGVEVDGDKMSTATSAPVWTSLKLRRWREHRQGR